MPASERQSYRSSGNTGPLYPTLPLMDIEMRDLEEDRKWKAVFDQFDHDHDGFITLGEFRTTLNGVSDNPVPTEVLLEIARWADRDNNGVLDYKEFVDMVRSHELGLLQPKLHRILKAAAFTVVPRRERPALIRTNLEEYKCCPPPLLMPILSLVEVGVFIYYAFELGGVGANGPVPFKSPLIYDPYRRYEAWRFVSYMLIHSGYMHLCTNLFVQLALGIPLEMVHHWWRLLIVYMAGVIAGSLGTSVADPNVFLAGASGGVYALLLAHLASLILNWKEMEFPILRLLFIVVLVGVDVGTAIYMRYFQQIDTKVGYAAHFCGALAGLLIGVNVLRNLRKEKWETIIWWLAFTIYVLSMAALIAINIFWTNHFPESKYCTNAGTNC